MMQGMARLYLLLFGLWLVLTVLALISCLSAEGGSIRVLPRSVWVVVILVVPLAGAVLYFVGGRPMALHPDGAQAGRHPAGGGHPAPARPTRPVAPDDDPEFLRSIDHRIRAEDEDMLRRWEDDLRRREDDLRKRGKTPDDTPSTDP
jgi:hypothetical protein